MGIKITGLDELSNKLKKLQRNVGKLHGSHKVSFDDLFSPQFMRKNTEFSSIDEMFLAGQLSVNSQEDFDAIPVDVLDALVQRTTKFQNWTTMKQKAGGEYGQKLLNKALKDSFR